MADTEDTNTLTMIFGTENTVRNEQITIIISIIICCLLICSSIILLMSNSTNIPQNKYGYEYE